jgi:hypothetical protein
VLPLTLMLLLSAADPDDGLSKQMLPIYLKEAGEYSIAVESEPKKLLELKKVAVFEWSNPVRSGLQQGVMFLWLRDGRPAALGSFWSQPEDRKIIGRKLYHEFHALDAEKLVVTRPDGSLNEWKPQAGLTRSLLPDAGTPAASPASRLLQMRKLAQEFTGHSIDEQKKRLDLRLLPAPLYRYPERKAGVVDGALFTLVSSDGTDPEVLLVIEAKNDGGKLRWEYACGRFSDRSLYVQRNEKEVWSSVLGGTNTRKHDMLDLYRGYSDKIVSLEGKVLARVRVTDKIWWGEIIPVIDK